MKLHTKGFSNHVILGTLNSYTRMRVSGQVWQELSDAGIHSTKNRISSDLKRPIQILITFQIVNPISNEIS